MSNDGYGTRTKGIPNTYFDFKFSGCKDASQQYSYSLHRRDQRPNNNCMNHVVDVPLSRNVHGAQNTYMSNIWNTSVNPSLLCDMVLRVSSQS